MDEPEFDLIIWGASGFTGALVVEYLVETCGVGGDLKWAIAGRDREKLRAVRAANLPRGQREKLPLLLADSQDRASLEALVIRTGVVCSTVGPYARYGTELVAACANVGTDYCDLSGEMHWIRQMIATYQRRAWETGARIVHSCGFDCIPSDLGTWYLQQVMLERHGVPARQVKGRVGRIRGGASGGTVASILNLMEEARRDPSIRRILADPYALYPAGVAPGLNTRDQAVPRYDTDFRSWTAPFLMSPLNTRVVRRSNALMGFPWGEVFTYEESLLCRSRWSAAVAAAALGAGMVLLATRPSRALARHRLPKPGEGPSREQREAGYFELFLHGKHPQKRDRDVRVRVAGDRDPGYGATARMLGEAALCLARDDLAVGGGFWTPASAMAGNLVERLQARAGLSFEVVESG